MSQGLCLKGEMALVSFMIQLPSLNICELAVDITVHVHPMEACIQQLHPFLTLALYGSKWSVWGPGHSIPGETTCGCVDPKSWCRHFEEEKINLSPLPGIKPWTVTQSLHYWGIQSLHITSDRSQSLTLWPCWFFCLIHSVYKMCLPSWNNSHDQFFGVFAEQLLA
jgi:hypothetical protein